mmetsp:Transcript_14477/g.46017  ORF Transcript_14477/g.46017 Transcript_14477/m.46017 type:complete len:215 (+) Transcript_14477:944-1588(+)
MSSSSCWRKQGPTCGRGSTTRSRCLSQHAWTSAAFKGGAVPAVPLTFTARDRCASATRGGAVRVVRNPSPRSAPGGATGGRARRDSAAASPAPGGSTAPSRSTPRRARPPSGTPRGRGSLPPRGSTCTTSAGSLRGRRGTASRTTRRAAGAAPSSSPCCGTACSAPPTARRTLLRPTCSSSPSPSGRSCTTSSSTSRRTGWSPVCGALGARGTS